MQRIIKCLIIILIVINQLRYTNNNLEVYYLNIGQGDSTLIKTSDNKYILIDGGPDDTVLNRLGETLPFWLKKIDVLILSHPDIDHLGGFLEIIERFEVNTLIYNTSGKFKSEYYTFFQNRVKELKINEIIPFKNDNLTIGCCTQLKILWGQNNVSSSESDVNDTSLAFVLDYLDFEVYFAGDLGKECEIESIRDNDIEVEIIKISHHGSKNSTSQELIENLNPKLAIISAGKENKFGHPHTETLDVLNSNNIPILRTDQVGNITISSDGNSFFIKKPKIKE